jgi:hypothetical protein
MKIWKKTLRRSSKTILTRRRILRKKEKRK